MRGDMELGCEIGLEYLEKRLSHLDDWDRALQKGHDPFSEMIGGTERTD